MTAALGRQPGDAGAAHIGGQQCADRDSDSDATLRDHLRGEQQMRAFCAEAAPIY
jgi:hypothetical protein